MPIKTIKIRFAISVIRRAIVSSVVLFLLFPARSVFAHSPEMVSILGGEFDMGSYEGERPVHLVKVDSFYMGKYEITNQQYCDYLNSAKSQALITVTSGVVYKAGSGTSYPYCNTSTSSSYSQISYSGDVFSVRTKGGRNMSNDPMIMVSWYGAVAYCNWLSQQQGKELCYNFSTWNCDFSKHGFRLPTEAEWEYGARGGLSSRRFPWGDDIYHTQANYYSSTSYSYDRGPSRGFHPLWNYTSPVGFFDGEMKYKTDYQWPGSATSYQTTSGKNNFDLYDMAGNVWEWCNDWWGAYSSSPQTNPTGPTSGGYRVLRGGGWNDRASYCRVASRDNKGIPGSRVGGDGFRVVLKGGGPEIKILLPDDNAEFCSGGSMRVEAKITGCPGAASIQVEGKINPDLNHPALTFQKFSDDGKTFGDNVAGDGIYTTEIGLPKLSTGNHTLQVTAYVTTPTGTKTVSDSVTFMVTGRPVGAPTVKLDVTPQNDVLIDVNDPVTITAQVSYPDPKILPEKVYAIIYTGGKEVGRFDLPKVGDVYTKTHIFTQPGPYQVDAIAEAPLGSGYAQSADSKGIYVHIDTLKVSLRIEPESPSGIYLARKRMYFVATVSTERGAPLPERFNITGQVRLPDGTTDIRDFAYMSGCSRPDEPNTMCSDYLPISAGTYSTWAYATASNYATYHGGISLPFTVTENSSKDELKAELSQARETFDGFINTLDSEAEQLCKHGDFLREKASDKKTTAAFDIIFGGVGALPLPIKDKTVKWVVGALKVPISTFAKGPLVDLFTQYSENHSLEDLYHSYESGQLSLIRSQVHNAIQDLEMRLYTMDPDVEDFYVNDLRKRMTANNFVCNKRVLYKNGIVYNLYMKLAYNDDIVVDLVLNGTTTLLTIIAPPIGLGASLFEGLAGTRYHLGEMEEAMQGYKYAFAGVLSLHLDAEFMRDNLFDFISQVDAYHQNPIPQGTIAIDDNSAFWPGLQEHMTGVPGFWFFSYVPKTAWTRFTVKNTGLIPASFSVNADFADTDHILQFLWMMKDPMKGTDLPSVFLVPNEERVVDLYFMDLTASVPFNYFPDRHPWPGYSEYNGSHYGYAPTGIQINYTLIATVKGTELYIVHELTDYYDPVGPYYGYSTGDSLAPVQKVESESATVAQEQSEPNTYRMVEYPIFNTFTKRYIAKPYTYRDAVTIGNPWSLPLAVTLKQPINSKMAVQSIGDPGVVEVNEIVWQVELHPHETKTLTYDFAVVGAKVPQSGFIAVPPATMSIYDSLSDIEARFESGNTRLRVWEEMPADFDASKDINLPDLSVFCYYWLEQDCNYPDWCGGTDLDYKGSVDLNDFAIFAQNWGWTKILADIDADGDIDLSDYAILANQWEEAPGFPSADVTPDNGDGIVDFWDLAMIAEYWLEATTP